MNKRPETLLLALFLLTTTIHSYTDPAACTASTQYYDVATLTCTTCPANTARARDFTFCNCSNTHYPNPDVIGFKDASSCVTAPSTYTVSNQIVARFALDGSVSPTVQTCTGSYPNSDNTRCIPCGPGTTYSTTLGCQCTTANQYWVAGGCYTNSNASWVPVSSSTSAPVDYLAQVDAVIGCGEHNVYQGCSRLINRCVFYQYASTNYFCQLLASYQTSKSPATGMPTYSFSSQITASISIFASSIAGTNTTTTKNTFQFILAEYNADGSLRDLKPLDGSIFSCYLNPQDIVDFQSYGANFHKTCATPRTFTTTYYYEVYVKDANGNYNEVPVSINNVYYKRFTPSAYNSIDVSLISIPPLKTPFFTLTNQSPAVVSTNSNAQSTTINYIIFLAIFGVGIMVLFILDFYRYLKYNPDENNDPYYCCKVVVLFLIQIVKFIAGGIWLFMFAFSTYCFCFYKFQRTVYIILPSPSNDTTGLYATFGAFFYITFSFTIVAIFIIFFKMVNQTDYFLIDWEKEKQMGKFEMGQNKKEVSVWRKVLVVNELYQLSMNRLINIEFVSLLSILFLEGLNWINLNANIPRTSPLVSDNIQQNNPILAYFIITFTTFTIAIVIFILRHATKTWFPLPQEDFVDLCSVCNVSIIIFDEALHGYYIHGMNPMGQSEGSLQYIENMFEKQAKAFGKSRSFKLEDVDQCQTFEIVFPMEVRQAFQVKYVSRFNQTLTRRAYATTFLSNPIPENLNDEDYHDLDEITRTMLQTFKFYLEGIKTSSMNVRERTLLEKAIDCPVDTETIGKLPIFFKDLSLDFTNVMVLGHEFILLFNFINFINIFYMATKNIYFSFFLAFIFEKIFIFGIGFFIKRNISKNTLIDDKFFN